MKTIALTLGTEGIRLFSRDNAKTRTIDWHRCRDKHYKHMPRVLVNNSRANTICVSNVCTFQTIE